MGKKNKKAAVLDVASTVKVICDESAGHPLSGLFIVFKLEASAPDGGKLDKIRQAGAAPQPESPTGDAKQKEKEPDPAEKFVIGIADQGGFLQPVHDGINPWYEIFGSHNPHGYKLVRDQKVRACLLRHPDAELARALAKYLNSQGVENAIQFDAWTGGKKWDSLLETFTVEEQKVGDKSQPILKLAAKPENYWPKGASQYESWLLYRDMPHAQCAKVPEQVQKLQENLGRLRYPVGWDGSPYSAKHVMGSNDEPTDELESKFDPQLQASVARFQENFNQGKAFKLDPGVRDLNHKRGWAYVMGQDEDKSFGKPLSAAPGVVDSDTAAAIQSWFDQSLRKPGAVLVQTDLAGGEPWIVAKGAVSLEAWSLLVKAFGCAYGLVAGSTLRNIMAGTWPGAIMNSIHKTGLAIDFSGGAQRRSSHAWPIRYEVHWGWKDTDLAEKQKKRDDAQHQLERRQAMEKKDPTVAASQTPSTATLQAAVTKAEQDLAQAKAKHPDLAADETGSKQAWQQRWRVYGHSSFDVFAKDPQAARAQLMSNLESYLGLPLSDASLKPGVGQLKALIKNFFPKALKDQDVDSWVSAQIKPMVDYASELLKLAKDDFDELVYLYFRTKVAQFNPNFYEKDSGTSGKSYSPTDADNDYSAADSSKFWPQGTTAKSWLNLTTLAYRCNIERIPPHQGIIRPKTPKTSPKAFPMAGYFQVGDQNLVDLMTDLTASKQNEAPQLQHGEDAFPVGFEGAKRRLVKVVKSLKPAEIDRDFFKNWRDETVKTVPHKKRKPADYVWRRDPQIGVTFSASEDGESQIKNLIQMLRNKFGDKFFVLLDVGTVMKDDLRQDVPLNGSNLGSDLETAQKNFKEKKATAQTEAGKPGGTDVPVKKEKSKKSAKPKPKPAVSKDADQWSVFIQPIFTKDVPKAKTPPSPLDLLFLPEHSVELPDSPAPSHLEWWHYQHNDHDRQPISDAGYFGPMVEDLGFSLAVLGVEYGGKKDGGPIHRGLGDDPAHKFKGFTKKHLGRDTPSPDAAAPAAKPKGKSSKKKRSEDKPDKPGHFMEGQPENRDMFTLLGG